MAKKRKGMVAAAAAFAATPQGRRMIAQAKEYATRPETKARAQQLVTKVRSRGKDGTPSGTTDPAPYGSPSGTPR